MDDLAGRFARYVEQRWEQGSDVRVESISRIHGGASRETYRVRISFAPLSGSGSERGERGLILRRDPVGSLIETDRANEFYAYRAFAGSEVPVPEALWLEADPEWLERPFFVMEEVAGCEAGAQALIAPPYAELADGIAEQKWSILGAIARTDPTSARLTEVMDEVAPDACWQRELDYWEKVIDEDELEPQPIARAAIRRLRREPPPPAARVGVVHGDFRTGNFLVDPGGTIRAILDWEMAHLGDPLEDLAWSINRTWCWARDGRVGGLVSRERALGIWEKASGLRADAVALAWWELFSSVKALAIWISGGREFRDGKNRDPIMALTGWFLPPAQERAILETLGKLS